MALSPDDVIEAFLILARRRLDVKAAEQIADLLGSREELLASLIVRERVFDRHPAIIAALRSAARRHHFQTATPRTETGDAVSRLRTTPVVAETIGALIAAELENVEISRRVDDALALAHRSESGSVREVAYHLLIEPEDRD